MKIILMKYKNAVHISKWAVFVYTKNKHCCLNIYILFVNLY